MKLFVSPCGLPLFGVYAGVNEKLGPEKGVPIASAAALGPKYVSYGYMDPLRLASEHPTPQKL